MDGPSDVALLLNQKAVEGYEVSPSPVFPHFPSFGRSTDIIGSYLHISNDNKHQLRIVVLQFRIVLLTCLSCTSSPTSSWRAPHAQAMPRPQGLRYRSRTRRQETPQMQATTRPPPHTDTQPWKPVLARVVVRRLPPAMLKRFCARRFCCGGLVRCDYVQSKRRL